MSKVPSITIAVGDDVRIHFHPPLPLKGFVEGTAVRVGRRDPIGRRHQEFVLFERWNDFPDQIEVLRLTTHGDQDSLSEANGQNVQESSLEASTDNQQNTSEQLNRRS